jgi:hypothetical protein
MQHSDGDIFLIDGNGPFFLEYPELEINWSKIPFPHLEANDGLRPAFCDRVEQAFTRFTQRAAAMGYNAVTLDDVAHLGPQPDYPETLNRKIEAYRTFYRRLFRQAQQVGMQVYLTTDLLFYTPELEQRLGGNETRIRAFTAAVCEQVLHDFPEVAGLVFRFGEADGLDVRGDFQSRLVLRTPKQARRMLETLLPVFEEHGRNLIFRTWSVGVSRIGDLIWNPDTFRQVFEHIHSPRLIISMKYGETDFFRYLPLNRLFFKSDHRKLIEFQARREYEGFGEFPSYIGNDYEHYRDELNACRNLAGISVWCQTGGWSGFRRLTLLEEGGLWNEINTYVTIKLFRERWSADQALQAFYKEKTGRVDWPVLQKLLQRSDRVIKELLYIDEFASRKIFFRRLRVPPLIAVYWRFIIINHLMRKLLRCFVSASRGEQLVREGYHALREIPRMKKAAASLGMPVRDFDFMYDTFRIIAVARAYYFLPFEPARLSRLEQLKAAYEQKWPEPRYTVYLDQTPLRMRRVHLRRWLQILFRRRPGYRLLDRVLALTLFSLLAPLLRRVQRRLLPDFIQQQAMGIHTVLK